VRLRARGDASKRRGAAAFLSMDDVGLMGNEFTTEAQGRAPGAFGVLAFAPTVRADGNRFMEPPDAVPYSYYSWGFLNTATGNQAMNCIDVLGPSTAQAANLVLNPNACKKQTGKTGGKRPPRASKALGRGGGG
jgi:hypothetical protein